MSAQVKAPRKGTVTPAHPKYAEAGKDIRKRHLRAAPTAGCPLAARNSSPASPPSVNALTSMEVLPFRGGFRSK